MEDVVVAIFEVVFRSNSNVPDTPIYNQSNTLLFSFRVQADSVVFQRNTVCLLYNFAVGKVSAHKGGSQ
ncbi:hypothetical protein [Treponema sp. R80B11-R83G3]